MTQVVLVPIKDILFDDVTRQRKELTGIDELVASIKKINELNPHSHGLLHPIILSETNLLLAGRRRLEAFTQMGKLEIPARYFNDLSPTDQKLVELDENLRRQDITWQERVLAVYELHTLLGSETASATADYIGLSTKHVSKYLQVAEELKRGDVKVASAGSASQAIALVDRRRTVQLDTELSKLHEELVARKEPPNQENRIQEPIARYSIIQANFLEWAPAYSGPKFNFLHCDFPYGIDAQESDSMGSAHDDSQYEDSPSIFWDLLTCLTDNIDNIMYDSGHILFWYHMKYYDEIIKYFQVCGLTVCEMPLIWHKSDGMGVAADYRRRPKHVYETALLISRGDRFISNVVNDLYPCPTARQTEGHMSAKPLPMLKHFFAMLVNELSSVLDPTCGSATSIRAAASLGAERALGLEINSSLITPAQSKLKAFLNLAVAAETLKKKAQPLSLTDI